MCHVRHDTNFLVFSCLCQFLIKLTKKILDALSGQRAKRCGSGNAGYCVYPTWCKNKNKMDDPDSDCSHYTCCTNVRILHLNIKIIIIVK